MKVSSTSKYVQAKVRILAHIRAKNVQHVGVYQQGKEGLSTGKGGVINRERRGYQQGKEGLSTGEGGVYQQGKEWQAGGREGAQAGHE